VESLKTPRGRTGASEEDSDGSDAPSKDADPAGGQEAMDTDATATGAAAEAPKTPPSTMEGRSEGEEPSSPGPASAHAATASKPGNTGGNPEDPCLGCFNLCIWFARDRARVLGMPKRHATLKSVTVSEALERQQQLSAKQRQQEQGSEKAHPLGFPLQTVLTSKPSGRVLAVEFGASSSATSKLIPLGDIFGLRRWAGKLHQLALCCPLSSQGMRLAPGYCMPSQGLAGSIMVLLPLFQAQGTLG